MKFLYRCSPLLFVCSLVLLPVSADAAMFRSGDSLRITESSEDDLYVGGGTVTLDAPVLGDYIGAAGEMIVNGDVSQDIIAAGGQVTVSGTVGDDIRVAGGEIRLNSAVADDAFFVGGRIDIREEATIGGDAVISGGDVFIDGTITGNLEVNAGRLVLHGDVLGDVQINAGEVLLNGTITGETAVSAEQISLGSEARFENNVRYWIGEGEVDFSPALVGSTATVDQSLRSQGPNTESVLAFMAAGYAASQVYAFLFALILILLVAALTRSLFGEMALTLRKSFWKQMLIGVLYFVLTPIICIFLLMTLIGIPFAVLLGVLYAFSIFASKPLAAMVFARWFQLRNVSKPKKRDTEQQFWSFVGWSLLFYVGLKLLGLIPILGWVAVFVLVSAAFGTLLSTKWAKFKELR